MLQNFFKLDGQPDIFLAADIEKHFGHSNDLRNVLYQPDDWPPTVRSVKKRTFVNVSLSKTKFGSTTFTDCTFEDCLFIGSTFDQVEFHRCRFVDCNFYKANFEACYIDPASFVFNRSYRKTAANVCVGLYQKLTENSSAEKQYDFERKADIEFRRWKRWQLGYDLTADKITLSQKLYRSFCNRLYELTCGYGYKPSRFIVATLLLFGLASLANMKLMAGQLSINNNTVADISLADSIFYTYSMMTALGFSSILPISPLAKIAAVAEALIGIGWLGIFTSLLVKRFLK